MAKLEIFLPDDTTRDYDLEEDKISLGRVADNDIQIDDESISGHHAEISKKGEDFILRDLGSTNGTFINEEKISERKLEDGVSVRFGKIDTVFRREADAPPNVAPLSQTREEEVVVAQSTARPADFFTSSPFPKVVEKPSPLRMAGFALAGVAVAGFCAVLYLVFQVMSVPPFSAP